MRESYFQKKLGRNHMADLNDYSSIPRTTWCDVPKLIIHELFDAMHLI